MHQGKRTLVWPFFVVCLLCICCVFWGWGAACAPMPAADEESSPQEPNPNEPIIDAANGDAPPTDQSPQDTAPDSGPKDSSPDNGTQDGQPPEEIVRTAIITPTDFSIVKFDLTTWTLPATVASETRLFFAIHPDKTTLFGGKTGLYQIVGDKVTRIDQTEVLGLLPWQATDLIVAQSGQLALWDGTALAPTTLHKQLDGAPITAIAGRDKDSFWIGTQKGLWLYQKDQVQQFSEIQGVKHLLYEASKKLLLLIDGQNQHRALEESPAGQWQMRTFTGEGVEPQYMFPIAPNRRDFWAITSQTSPLYLRKTDNAQAAWWPYRLKPDTNADDKETVPVKTLLYQEKVGQTWAVTSEELYTLTEETSTILQRPTELKDIKTANSTSDGAMWLSDGTTLVRVGQTSAPLSYQTDVVPILKKYCLSCHKKGSQAEFAPFETYEQVKAKAALIVKRTSVDRNMPPKSAPPLPNDQILILKSWVADGMQP